MPSYIAPDDPLFLSALTNAIDENRSVLDAQVRQFANSISEVVMKNRLLRSATGKPDLDDNRYLANLVEGLKLWPFEKDAAGNYKNLHFFFSHLGNFGQTPPFLAVNESPEERAKVLVETLRIAHGIPDTVNDVQVLATFTSALRYPPAPPYDPQNQGLPGELENLCMRSAQDIIHGIYGRVPPGHGGDPASLARANLGDETYSRIVTDVARWIRHGEHTNPDPSIPPRCEVETFRESLIFGNLPDVHAPYVRDFLQQNIEIPAAGSPPAVPAMSREDAFKQWLHDQHVLKFTPDQIYECAMKVGRDLVDLTYPGMTIADEDKEFYATLIANNIYMHDYENFEKSLTGFDYDNPEHDEYRDGLLVSNDEISVANGIGSRDRLHQGLTELVDDHTAASSAQPSVRDRITDWFR